MTYDPWKTTTLAWVSAFLKGCWFLIIWGKNTVIWYNFCIMALFSIHLIWKRNFIFFTYPNNLTNHLPHKSAGHHTFIGQLTQQQKKLKIFILHCCCVNCQLTLSKYSLWLTYEENDYLSYKDMWKKLSFAFKQDESKKGPWYKNCIISQYFFFI